MKVQDSQLIHEIGRDYTHQKIINQTPEVLCQLNCLYEQGQKQKLESPSSRMNAEIVYYKNKLYVYGGQQFCKHQDRSAAFYSFNLEDKKWSIHFPKVFSREFARFTPKASTVLGKKWFMLGESGSSTQKDSTKNWKLNFDVMDWTIAQQKGEVPKHLQGGSLVSYQKNFLVYYGGYSQTYNKFNSSVYLYNVDSKTWHKCQGNYQKVIKSRFYAGMISVNNKIFLYGGYYKQAENLQCLNEFYEITLRLPGKAIHSEAYFRVIPTSSPSARAQHHFFAFDNNTICLFGGKNNQSSTEKDIWTFHLITGQWTLIEKVQEKINKREGSSIAAGGNNIYIFGGSQEEQDGKYKLYGDVWSLNVNYSQLYSTQQQVNKIESFITSQYNSSCKLCYQKKNDFVMNTGKFSAGIIDEAVSQINFPYAAFGLIIDKSVSMGATLINVSIDGEQSNHYICIEDNAKIIFTQRQLMRSLCGFEGTSNLVTSGIDKKIKKQIQKDNLLKEFGVNLKIGALRLGKKFLFVSGNGEIIHLFLCLKDKVQSKQLTNQLKQQTNKEAYVVHYYAVDANTKQLVDSDMQNTREYIESRYRKQVKLVTASRAIKNTLFIFETCLNSKQQQIIVNYQQNDVLYGNQTQIEKLANYGYNMNDCIDVSLRAYLSVLYLRCEQIKINFGIKLSSVTIIPQYSLQKVDKACRSGYTIELEDVLQFEFKLVEIYWQRQIRRNHHFFSNGLLIYSKNRLISRYRIQLGGLLPLMAKQVTSLTKYLPFFGFAQLPQHIAPNIFKTGFSFSILMEKLFCRLKFVQQGFKKRQTILGRPNRPNVKNDRREKLGDLQAWGSKKRARKSKPVITTNIQNSLRSAKGKNNKRNEIQNVSLFIKQKQEQNKSNEQFSKAQKVEQALYQSQQKQEVDQPAQAYK